DFALLAAAPTAFFVGQFVAARLRLPSEAGDLVGAGAGSAGTLAVNAVSPVVTARRPYQALGVFWLCLLAVAFAALAGPVARALGLSATDASALAQLWSADPGTGLGSQPRFLLLAVALIFFGVLRGRRAPADRSVFDLVPPFVLGFFAFAAARAIAEWLFS